MYMTSSLQAVRSTMPDGMHVSFPPEIADNIKQHFLRTDMAKTVKTHGVVFVEFNTESATITGGKTWNQLGMAQTIKKVVKKLLKGRMKKNSRKFRVSREMREKILYIDPPKSKFWVEI